MLFLFDMDGTLCDSRQGIVRGLEVALSMMGREMPPQEELSTYIGPPLQESFMKKMGMNAVEARTTIKWFRDYYMRKGKYENQLYPGMREVLRQAKLKGRVGLATSKPEIVAKDILDHFEVASYFDLICGASLDGRVRTKEEVLQRTLDQVKEDRREIYMIGDRYTDREGAKFHGLNFVGVLYGYGRAEEFQGCDCLMKTPKDLEEWVKNQ